MSVPLAPDNTPPVAKAALEGAPSNANPVAGTITSFAPDNTAPAKRAAVAAAPDNTAPGTVNAVYTPSNVAPVAKAEPDFSPDNTAPTKHSAFATAPDNTAPVAATATNFTPSNANPAAKAAGEGAPDAAAPGSITPAVFTPSNAAPGTLTAPTNNGTAEPPQAIAQDPLSPPTDQNVNTPVLNIPGALVLNQIFGWVRVTAAATLIRAQVQLNDAPVGAAAKIALVDSDGNPLGVEVTVPDGQTFGQLVLVDPIALLVDANIRAKVTQVGIGDAPGGFGVVTLYMQLAS